ncbi:MAG: hypothetical protein JXR60_00300 [Bacteroidales bacterium]|nr:hypothetical protein [Bacteroidales bacterium]
MNDFLNQVDNENVLVIGDVMIDAYLWGAVNRISPEAPVPIVTVTKRENRLGGAANVGLNLKSLGANPIICSVIGSDDGGDIILDLMEESQMTSVGLILSKKRKTTKKTRVLSNGQQLLRVDDEITYQIAKDLEDSLIERIEHLIHERSIGAIIFEDYDKGVITKRLIDSVVELAKANKIIVAADPKKNQYDDYHDIDLFKPNFKEFVEGSKQDFFRGDTESIFKYAKQIISEKDFKNVMVTLSDLGVFITDGKVFHLIPAEYRQIADVSGAGDSVISIATLLLLNGYSIKTIADISNKAGGIVCEKVGVVPIEIEDLLAEINSELD